MPASSSRRDRDRASERLLTPSSPPPSHYPPSSTRQLPENPYLISDPYTYPHPDPEPDLLPYPVPPSPPPTPPAAPTWHIGGPPLRVPPEVRDTHSLASRLLLITASALVALVAVPSFRTPSTTPVPGSGLVSGDMSTVGARSPEMSSAGPPVQTPSGFGTSASTSF